MAAAGTDGANCNAAGGALANTGASANCVSTAGAFDMVGNLWEWTADLTPDVTSWLAEHPLRPQLPQDSVKVMPVVLTLHQALTPCLSLALVQSPQTPYSASAAYVSLTLAEPGQTIKRLARCWKSSIAHFFFNWGKISPLRSRIH